MRRCSYHKDLGQNAVFHDFGIQIAIIQYLGRSKHALAKLLKNFTYTTSRFSLLTSAKVDRLNDNFKKILDLDGSTPEPVIRSGDMVSGYPVLTAVN